MDRIAGIGVAYLFIRSLEHTVFSLRSMKVLFFSIYFLIILSLGQSIVYNNYKSSTLIGNNSIDVSVLDFNVILGNVTIVGLLIGLVFGIAILFYKFVSTIYEIKKTP